MSLLAMAPSRLLPIATFLAEGFPVRPSTPSIRAYSRALSFLSGPSLPIAADASEKPLLEAAAALEQRRRLKWAFRGLRPATFNRRNRENARDSGGFAVCSKSRWIDVDQLTGLSRYSFSFIHRALTVDSSDRHTLRRAAVGFIPCRSNAACCSLKRLGFVALSTA